MKVIDLLNRIANGGEVPLIKYRDKILHWNKGKDRFEDKDGMNTLYEIDFSELNDEVEIIEENKKIETIDPIDPIDYCHSTDTSKDVVLVEKINEIIDKINSMEDK